MPDEMSVPEQLAVVVRAVANIPSSVNIEIRLSAQKLIKEWLQVNLKYGVFGRGDAAKKVYAEIIRKGMADTVLEKYFRDQRSSPQK